MKAVKFLMLLTVFFAVFAACKGKKTDKPEDKKDETTTTATTNSNTTTTTAASLDGEWTIKSINGEATKDMTMTFSGSDITVTTAKGSDKATFTKEGNMLLVKSKEGDDKWEIKTHTDKELIFADTKTKNEFILVK